MLDINYNHHFFMNKKNIFFSSVMMAGMIEMLEWCAECLDTVNMVPLPQVGQPMDLWWMILSWMMSIVLGQKELLKTAVTTQ